MRLRQSNLFTALMAGVALAAGTSCSGDRPLTAPPRNMSPAPANATLWDGSQVGGNPNVFFLPPLVANPQGQPTYGVNPFQSGLPVEIEIACLTAPTGSSCAGRGLPRTAAGLSNSDQQYQLNWDTRAPGFDPNFVFRIKVWIGSRNVAFADVILLANANPKNKNTSDDIPLNDGRTMPIKVHVQTGWACINQASCVSQVVGNTPPAGQTFTQVKTNDGEDLAAFPANWFDPRAVGTNQVLVTIEDVTPNVPNCSALGGRTQLTTMLARNHCVRLTTDPVVQHVTNTVLIATCVDNPGDTRQLILKYDLDESPIFLRNVNVSAQTGFICPETHIGMSRSANPLVRYASNTLTRLGNTMRAVFGPKTAYAIDQGVGGALDAGEGFSVFNLAFGASMSIVSGNDQTAAAGITLPAAQVVRLSALHVNPASPGSAVIGQKLACAVTSGGGSFLIGDATVSSAPATDNKDGTYSCPNLTLGGTPGLNTVVVSSATLDPTIQIEEVGEESSFIGTFSGTATFTATGTSGATITGLQASSPLEIDGALGNYTTVLVNGTNAALTNNLALQGYIVQGPVKHAAGGIVILCGDLARGTLPPGPCNMNFSINASNSHEEAGALAPGAAKFQLDLRDASGTILDSKSVDVTLVNPPVIGN